MVEDETKILDWNVVLNELVKILGSVETFQHVWAYYMDLVRGYYPLRMTAAKTGIKTTIKLDIIPITVEPSKFTMYDTHISIVRIFDYPLQIAVRLYPVVRLFEGCGYDD